MTRKKRDRSNHDNRMGATAGTRASRAKAQKKAKKAEAKAKKAHSSFVSPHAVAAIAMNLNIITTEAVPTRQQRDPDAPPPKRIKKKQSAKPFSGIHSGLFARIGASDTIDFASIAAEPPTCLSKSCKYQCCAAEGAWQQQNAADKSAKVREYQDAMRSAHDEDGKQGADAYLVALIAVSTSLAAGSRRFVKRKPVVEFQKGDCAWCRTVPGDIERDHYCRKGICPRWRDAMVYATSTAPKRSSFYLPPLADGGPKQRVSRTFFQALFHVNQVRIKRLQDRQRAVDATTMSSQSGKHGNHSCMSEEDVANLEGELLLALSTSEDHYERADRTDRYLTLADDVTFSSLWWGFCEKYDTPFAEQCVRVGFKFGLHDKKHQPSDDVYTADIAVS